MASIDTVKQPITGREDKGEVSETVAALSQFYRAFNGRDLALMAESWQTSDEVVMDGPLGGVLRGWPAIRSLYDWVFRGPARVQIELHDHTLHVVGDVFYAVGRERGRVVTPGGALDLAIRTTRIFRRVDGSWRQVHHHGSIDDPQLLEAYQRAVPIGDRHPMAEKRTT